MKRTFLEEFHKVAYKYLGRAKDATFELTDAILLCNFRPLTKSPQGITTNTTIRSDCAERSAKGDRFIIKDEHLFLSVYCNRFVRLL
jgi:hypothetical protein